MVSDEAATVPLGSSSSALSAVFGRGSSSVASFIGSCSCVSGSGSPSLVGSALVVAVCAGWPSLSEEIGASDSS